MVRECKDLRKRPSGFEQKERKKKSGKGEEGPLVSGHEASPSMLCPILLKVPLSTNQMITPTTPATMARKNIQKHQQTMVRFFFLLFWRASQESLWWHSIS